MALALDPEQIASSEDGRLNPALEATDSVALEPNTDLALSRACVIGTSESSPAIGSKPRTSAPVETDQAPVIEFTSADIFRHLPLGDVLSSLKALSLSGDPQPNYVRLEVEAEDEFCFPPTTHLIATVKDLTDLLNYASEDFEGMDLEAG